MATETSYLRPALAESHGASTDLLDAWVWAAGSCRAESKADGQDWLSHQMLFQQSDEDFVGNSEARGRETEKLPVKFDDALISECGDTRADRGDSIALAIGGVIAFDTREIYAFELAKAEEEFFFESLCHGNGLDLFAGAGALFDVRDVGRRIVEIGPARMAIEGMRAGAEAEIWLAAPIF